MEEMNKNVKRRERIKTIMIIFLLIILLLTFFSNSIMNHSLPTVSAQYASYGTINEKVRGSGLVTANQNYEVVAEGSRTVSQVSIKQGDEVKAGDTLFVLEAAEDDEAIKAAEESIKAAELAYQKALLTAAPDYDAQNQEIANARADLQTAIRKLNEARNAPGSSVSAADYQRASARAKAAATRISELSGYQAMVSSGELDGLPQEYLAGLQAAKAALDIANEQLAAAQADVDTKFAAVTVTSAEQESTILSLERAAETADTAYQRAKSDYEASNGDMELRRAMEDAEQTARYAHEDIDNAKSVLTGIKASENALSDARAVLNQATADQKSAQRSYDTAVSGVGTLIQTDLNAANAEADEAAAVISAYESEQGEGGFTDISSLEEAVSAGERNLQSLLLTLSKTKKDDALNEQINKLDLESQKNDIDKQKTELEKLKKNAGTLTVTSKNDGVVNNVNFAVGDDVMEGAVLASITLTGSGYTLQFSVTAEQAKMVKVGTNAEITNNYYSDITAKLLSSKADTENPSSNNRILTFEITGKDVTPGQMLALSIPCSSQSYDCVVPSSAIMEDNDGKFVLIMESKSTPLGNRYYATRANVTVLASDEVNSAVQGDVNPSAFIITTSEKPLTPGTQVRMED